MRAAGYSTVSSDIIKSQSLQPRRSSNNATPELKLKKSSLSSFERSMKKMVTDMSDALVSDVSFRFMRNVHSLMRRRVKKNLFDTGKLYRSVQLEGVKRKGKTNSFTRDPTKKVYITVKKEYYDSPPAGYYGGRGRFRRSTLHSAYFNEMGWKAKPVKRELTDPGGRYFMGRGFRFRPKGKPKPFIHPVIRRFHNDPDYLLREVNKILAKELLKKHPSIEIVVNYKKNIPMFTKKKGERIRTK